MALTLEDMKHLCELAKIQPKQEDLEVYAGQCAKIIEYMDELSEVDTSSVTPLYSPITHTTQLREDSSTHRRTREEVLSGAPLTDGTYFIVPKIVEGK